MASAAQAARPDQLKSAGGRRDTREEQRCTDLGDLSLLQGQPGPDVQRKRPEPLQNPEERATHV